MLCDDLGPLLGKSGHWPRAKISAILCL